MSKLFIVPTPIGNLKDMTQRAVETLKEVDLIAAEDTRHTQQLLNVFEIKTKLISYHKFNETMRSQEIIDEILNGKNVAIVTDAGTPCISDPGFELVKAAREQEIEVVGLAGASAVTTALSISGINTNEFAFYGFLPRKKGELMDSLKRILNNPIKTFVIYESPKRVINLAENIKEVMPNATLCIVKELTKLHEHAFYGSVDEVINQLNDYDAVEKGEYVVVGYNNDYEEKDATSDAGVSIYGILFDKIFNKEISVKEAVNEIVEENIATKNEAYKASLELKKFIENF